LLQFTSQHGEDRWLLQNREIRSNGVFVEVGADDGIANSNTKLFEDLGWTGLCIEPHPERFALLRQNRRCKAINCAITSQLGQQFYLDTKDPTWSGFRSQEHRRVPVNVETKRLDDALREAQIDHIDLLSIDTEGSELDVWASFDHNIWKPNIVIIEWETQGVINTTRQVLETFRTLPYRMVHQTVGNFIFERQPS